MRIIAIVNEKGGTGKTTTSVNLSASLGEMGKQVLLVDLDGQAASSRWLGVEEDTSFADALWRGEGLEPIRDVIPGVSLAPGSGKLDSVAHDLRPTQGGQLRKLLGGVCGFDYVVIDCPPSLGNRLIGNALLAATHAIVPVETSILALDGLRILLTTFSDIRDGFGHDVILAGVLACRYDARTKLSAMVLAELNRVLPGRVFQTVIRENVRVRECPGSGQSVLSYASTSHAAEDYRALAREVTARLEGAGPALEPAAGALVDDVANAIAELGLPAQERLAACEVSKQVEDVPAESENPAPACAEGLHEEGTEVPSPCETAEDAEPSPEASTGLGGDPAAKYEYLQDTRSLESDVAEIEQPPPGSDEKREEPPAGDSFRVADEQGLPGQVHAEMPAAPPAGLQPQGEALQPAGWQDREDAPPDPGGPAEPPAAETEPADRLAVDASVQAPSPGDEMPPDEGAADSDSPARERVAVGSSPQEASGADAPTEPSSEFPALRAMLEQLQGGPAVTQSSGRSDSGQDEDNQGWRRLLKKVAGVK